MLRRRLRTALACAGDKSVSPSSSTAFTSRRNLARAVPAAVFDTCPMPPLYHTAFKPRHLPLAGVPGVPKWDCRLDQVVPRCRMHLPLGVPTVLGKVNEERGSSLFDNSIYMEIIYVVPLHPENLQPLAARPSPVAEGSDCLQRHKTCNELQFPTTPLRPRFPAPTCSLKGTLV